MTQDLRPIDEVVKAGALNTPFFGRYFFPRSIRQDTPEFHYEICHVVENPANRYSAIKVFRGGAKTTLCRVIGSKRISYGLSRTILLVSEAQNHAMRSLRWIKGQVMFNERWTQAFGIRQGSKWTDEEIEIVIGATDQKCSVVALGITGQTRGINIDDYRPDFILVDDPNDEENVKTFDQRQKISNIFHGAIAKSLAPATENPDAKLVLLQTPLARGDVIDVAMKDPQFAKAEFGCFDEQGRSRWEARFPTETLRKEKEAHISRGQLALWMREMEVKIVSEELSSFKQNHLDFWEHLPEAFDFIVVAVDPTPPPKDSDQQTTNRKLDDAAIVAIGFHKKKAYLLEYYTTKSPNPEELITKIFDFYLRYQPMKVGVETVLFARVIKYYLELEMNRRGIFFVVVPVEDRRKKSVRILQALSGRTALRMLSIHRTHTEFIEQFVAYPDVEHDDLLDAVSIALMLVDPTLQSGYIIDGEATAVEEKAIANKGCP